MVGGVDLIDADIADFGDFKIDPRSGVLEFRSPPNYESPADAGVDNTYNVVVQATDGDAGPPIGADNLSEMDTRSWFKVTVNVSDVEETGSVTLRPTGQTSTTLLQPQVEVGITAADLIDGDNAQSTPDPTYEWYRTTSRSATGTAISGATNPAYTPVHLEGDSDIGKYLRVVATYTDGNGGGKTATAVSLYPTIGRIGDNEPPSFTDGATTTRAVREDAAKDVNIGLPVTATDRESPASSFGEKLTYWLTGTSASYFSIEAHTGQIMTKNKLNYETDDDDATFDASVTERTVTVNVQDSHGDATNNQDSITVTIRVLQVDESPTITGEATIEHVEGTTALDTDLSAPGITAETDDARYTATDPEGGTITFSLGGADKDLFRLDDPVPAVTTATKVLVLKRSLTSRTRWTRTRTTCTR